MSRFLSLSLLLVITNTGLSMAQDSTRTFYKAHRITLDLDAAYSGSGGLGGFTKTYSTIMPRLGYTLTDRWVVGGFVQFGKFTSENNAGMVNYLGGGVFSRYYLLKTRFSIFPQVSLGANGFSGPSGSETVPTASVGGGIQFVVGKRRHGAIALTYDQRIKLASAPIYPQYSFVGFGYHFRF